METRYIYTVSGVTGEYADRHDWQFAAFLSEEKAKIFLSHCQQEYQDALAQFNGDVRELHRQADRKSPKDFGITTDPYCHIDYTGTEYYITKIPLLDESASC